MVPVPGSSPGAASVPIPHSSTLFLCHVYYLLKQKTTNSKAW